MMIQRTCRPSPRPLQIGSLCYSLSELGLWPALCAWANDFLAEGGKPSVYEMNKTVDIIGSEKDLAEQLSADEEQLRKLLAAVGGTLNGDGRHFGHRLLKDAVMKVSRC